MSEKQTEVQRLAKQLEDDWYIYEAGQSILDASAELINMHTANAELVNALRVAFLALDAISKEMTVGERYTNAGQYLIDALPVVREALEKHGGE